MKNQQHNVTILQALRYEQKNKEKYLRSCHARNIRAAKSGKPGFWDNSIKRTQDRLEELAEAIEYMESLPIYLGCTSNKGIAK